MNVGILGGSFNPPHIGHLLLCQYVLAIFHIDEIWLVPVTEHPFGKKLVSYDYRLDMCNSFYAYNNKIRTLNIYNKFTIDLVKALKTSWDHNFSLIIGSDIIKDLNKWKDYDEIRGLISIKTITRGDGLIPNISSTHIRKRLIYNLPVNEMLPRGVLDYIERHEIDFS